MSTPPWTDATSGGVADEVEKRVKDIEKQLPKGSHIIIRGQVQTMKTSFTGLGFGLLGAIVLAYLLIVVNFQSWLDPFIIITALPGRARGNLLDAVDYAYYSERAIVDRRDHVHGRGYRE